MNKNINRRNFLKLAGGAVAGAGLAQIVGCHDDDDKAQCNGVYDKLQFTTHENLFYDLNIERCTDKVNVVDTSGNGNDRLHFYEANYELHMGQPSHVQPGEYFVVNSNIMKNGETKTATRVLRYLGQDASAKTLYFHDPAIGGVPVDQPNREITYLPSPLYPGTGVADLIISGIDHLTYVDIATGKLVPDQTGDDDHQGVQAPIVDITDKLTLEEDLLAP